MSQRPTTSRTKTSRNSPAPRVPHAFSPPLTTSDSSLLVDGRDDAMRETIYLMVLSLDRLQTCREAFGRAMDLTGSQFAVLMGVAYTQGRIGVSIGALAIHVHLAATHVTTEVGRLIRLGLLEKVPSPTDRRSVLVSLTQKGEEAVQSVAPLVRSVNDRLFAGMSREDLGQVHEFFTRFALNSEFALVELRHKDVRKRPAPARTRTELLP